MTPEDRGEPVLMKLTTGTDGALWVTVDGADVHQVAARISAVCDVDNIGSARAMEKAGLVREGLLRRLMIHPNVSDEPRDCFGYAIVR